MGVGIRTEKLRKVYETPPPAARGGGFGFASGPKEKGPKKKFEIVALDDVSFEIRAGEIFGLLGPNGAGKTTSIRMIMNITIPDVGTVRLFGDDLGGRHHSARIGYLPEERGLYKKMKVRDMLVFLAEVKGVARKAAAAKADAWLDRLGLGEWSRRKVEELSKGMSQKVQFIGTMLHEPELLILDEPFQGLDPVSRADLVGLLNQLHRLHGVTLVVATHDVNVVKAMADVVYVLAGRGEIVAQGTPDEVFRDAARLKRSNVEPPVLAELFQRLEELGVPLGRPLQVEEAAQALLDWGRSRRAVAPEARRPAPAGDGGPSSPPPAPRDPGVPPVQPTLPLERARAPGEDE
jgi:ABC-type uncharacterized transport system ATPase subunit